MRASRAPRLEPGRSESRAGPAAPNWGSSDVDSRRGSSGPPARCPARSTARWASRQEASGRPSSRHCLIRSPPKIQPACEQRPAPAGPGRSAPASAARGRMPFQHRGQAEGNPQRDQQPGFQVNPLAGHHQDRKDGQDDDQPRAQPSRPSGPASRRHGQQSPIPRNSTRLISGTSQTKCRVIR